MRKRLVIMKSAVEEGIRGLQPGFAGRTTHRTCAGEDRHQWLGMGPRRVQGEPVHLRTRLHLAILQFISGMRVSRMQGLAEHGLVVGNEPGVLRVSDSACGPMALGVDEARMDQAYTEWVLAGTVGGLRRSAAAEHGDSGRGTSAAAAEHRAGGGSGPGVLARDRSAGFQPAVSPVSNRQAVRNPKPVRLTHGSRIGNPRHSRLEVCATSGGCAANPRRPEGYPGFVLERSRAATAGAWGLAPGVANNTALMESADMPWYLRLRR
jgi:hypothetical protein